MLKRRALTQLIAAASLAPGVGQAQGRPPLTRIAFGSCAEQRRPQPIWDAVLAYHPDLFIFAGDNVYGDFDTADAAGLRQAYDGATHITGYTSLLRTVPHLAIWDDHDYGLNDGGADFAHKAIAKEEFLRFWNVPADDVRRTREGIHNAHIIGPPGMRVQVILLDLRWFRSPLKPTDQRGAPGKERYVPDADPAKTMLGEAQWAWLAAELRKPAEVRLLVSTIQVLAEGHGWERWGNFPLERQKLFDTIRDSNASGVVLLSGDRHFGALYRETPAGGYPLYEITSSGLNMIYWNVREPGPNRLGAVYPVANFGAIDIDWWERTVTLALRDESGSVRRSATIKADELLFSK
ncbi:alkaline phosphatase D family protein [Reyranella sp.]|uniref:alkaline phosphatase D family protein n=1 Tax=Reyranella sp. TaxID=1929291 RepID=UPI003D095A3A